MYCPYDIHEHGVHLSNIIFFLRVPQFIPYMKVASIAKGYPLAPKLPWGYLTNWMLATGTKSQKVGQLFVPYMEVASIAKWYHFG